MGKKRVALRLYWDKRIKVTLVEAAIGMDWKQSYFDHIDKHNKEVRAQWDDNSKRFEEAERLNTQGGGFNIVWLLAIVIFSLLTAISVALH